MKKILVSLLLVSMVFYLSSCSGAGSRAGKDALETADTVYDMTADNGSVIVDESVAKAIISTFDKSVTGLKKDAEDYNARLSQTKIFGKSACLVELFDGDIPDDKNPDKKPAGKFIIEGDNCYMPGKNGSYLLLTAQGAEKAVETTAEATTQSAAEDTSEAFEYDKGSDKALRTRFAEFDYTRLGLQRGIENYIFVPTSLSATASDSSTVYIIKLYETDGTPTNYLVAFNEKHVYSYNLSEKIYEPLK